MKAILLKPNEKYEEFMPLEKELLHNWDACSPLGFTHSVSMLVKVGSALTGVNNHIASKIYGGTMNGDVLFIIDDEKNWESAKVEIIKAIKKHRSNSLGDG